MKKVLVLCTGNSCRSQIAEGYLRHFAHVEVEIYSAGVETHGVNTLAAAVMAEDGVDISRHTSNNVDEYAGVDFDYIITVCDHALERCPVFPSDAEKTHQNFPDPAKTAGDPEEVLEEFRKVRNMIKTFSEDFARKKLS